MRKQEHGHMWTSNDALQNIIHDINGLKHHFYEKISGCSIGNSNMKDACIDVLRKESIIRERKKDGKNKH